eukprot:CAMPEP_0202449362 /NCGR_PEP_ID=MMETSP1360-20130828/8094_1 /ASSEMBLY_ACC=CAM_ASM_000848 /TAXON_ID=515479 /ORGANISM="Licmophora paradoxa, Strain CCMP2313" /LENGTH=516 /DNA_ID=CAMNT_0049067255 /DNA_START=27 /DNA_END=1577 /DNA_ORIENTATION=-
MQRVDDDDARHRREEAERRKARKLAKSKHSRSGGSEKDRKRREHAQRVLQGQSKSKLAASSAEDGTSSSAFQALFQTRAQGFKIEFCFRNAPPRPPVGPCFLGPGLDGWLQEYAQYRPLNAVEQNYQWKLHTEPDLGVPLAPSAMDLASYKNNKSTTQEKRQHPDDDALLNWKGSLGDTAAEELQQRRDNARAAARSALAGKAIPANAALASSVAFQKKKQQTANAKKHNFSRVLDERMVSFMKKTTYLSNDHSRKVHDFTSLAKTKQKTEEELAQKRSRKRITKESVEQSFDAVSSKKQQKLQHPTKPKAKPVWSAPLLPNTSFWGNAYTHVVVDNPPKNEPDLKPITQSFLSHIEKRDAQARMTCQVMVPYEVASSANTEGKQFFRSMAQYDMDVIPLKEEDEPHTNFCIWMNHSAGGENENNETPMAVYLPIPSRVQLSTGRPGKKVNTVSRRPLGPDDAREHKERLAEVDRDIAAALERGEEEEITTTTTKTQPSSFGDFGDDDDDDDDDDE